MKFTRIKCPHCGATIDFQLEGGGGTVQDFGESVVFQCKQCTKHISNGLKEWGELGWLKKTKAILRTIYTILFYGVSVGGLLGAIAMYALKLTESQLAVTAVLLIGASICVFGLLHIIQIRREIRLSNERLGSRTEQ